MTSTVSPSLGFRFLDGEEEELLARVIAMAHQPYAYVITPNVDFVVRAYEDAVARSLYDGAAVQICDSRVLQLALMPLGLRLSCLPGSDMVQILLNKADAKTRFLVVGPTEERMDALRRRYPQRLFTLVNTPRAFSRGDADWQRCLFDAANSKWDIALLCLGSPKQEAFAADLAALRSAPGVALCVGASIDFLTGVQVRAPRWMQRIALEWLFRLASNPRRLWQRYLVANPRFFGIIFKELLRQRLTRAHG